MAVAHWHSAFLHHHHESEDERFRLFPDAADDLARLTAEHAELDAELKRLADGIAAIRGADATRAREIAADTAHPAAVRSAHRGELPAARALAHTAAAAPVPRPPPEARGVTRAPTL